MYFGALCKAFSQREGLSFAISHKKAPDWVLLLYLEVVATIVVGGLVLPVEVDKVIENSALSVV